jgi:hypothetical protein
VARDLAPCLLALYSIVDGIDQANAPLIPSQVSGEAQIEGLCDVFPGQPCSLNSNG